MNQYILVGVSILAMLEGVAAMIIPLLLTYLFPAKVRLTGVAICYNIGFTIFGGMAPIIISSAIKSGVNIYVAPLSFIMAIIASCAIVLYYAHNYSHESMK